mmetsp:Transcript_43012/g.98859  ORF Transcript_43012/g.98859 Transcript_43012/m.98859 type:complete len:770 (+) Transcript_43012:94-2403(+)
MAKSRVAKGKSQQAIEWAQAKEIDSFRDYLTRTYGSVHKAWRRVLDPDDAGDLLFSEFVEALARAGWEGDTTGLWNALVARSRSMAGDVAIGLREIVPEDHALLLQCRDWVTETFGGALAMFSVLTDDLPNSTLPKEHFVMACETHGFQGPAGKIFSEMLDLDGEQSITVREIACLETNALKKKAALDPSFVMEMEMEKDTVKRIRRRRRRKQKQKSDAIEDFRFRLGKAAGGSFIRGWRKILDDDGNLTVSKVELLKGCKKIDFVGNATSLWKIMDTDDEGMVNLCQVDVRVARVLAMFRRVASKQHGSCAAALQKVSGSSPGRRRNPKWTLEDLQTAMEQLDFPSLPGVTLKQAATIVHDAFDLKGVGVFTIQDVAFLDKWEPTPWLCGDPDEKEKDKFLNTLRQHYPSLIVAWRRLLDKDNTNSVSYKDFCEACRVLHFPQPAGIWCALDPGRNGRITLEDIDPDSAGTLVRFKVWSESTFGSIQKAYRCLSANRGRAVPLPVFKRWLRDFGFEGDARGLFHSLKPDGGRDAFMTLDDMKYLSSWGDDELLEDSDSEDERSLGGGEGRRRPKLGRRASGQLQLRRESTNADDLSAAGKAAKASLASGQRLKAPPTKGVHIPAAPPKDWRSTSRLWYCRGPSEFTAMSNVPATTKPQLGVTLSDLLQKRSRGEQGVYEDPYKAARPTDPASKYMYSTNGYGISKRVLSLGGLRLPKVKAPATLGREGNAVSLPALDRYPPAVTSKPLPQTGGLTKLQSLPALPKVCQ